MEVKIIEYKNQKILYADYRGSQSEEDNIRLLRQGFELVGKTGGVTRSLTNCTGVEVYTEGFVNALKGGFQDRQGKVAVVGLSGLSKTIGQGVDTFAQVKNVKLFDTEEKAKEWLIS